MTRKEAIEILKKWKPRASKPNLGVENDLVSSIVEKISEKVTETREEFIFETIRPYCENVVQMKISKRDLEQALLKYYGKNDLGVDCISRQAVLELIADYDLSMGQVVKGIHALPSVTPEPKTGHWIEDAEQHHVEKTYHCSECGHGAWGEYEKTEYCGGCGSKMVEPQESEDNNGTQT